MLSSKGKRASQYPLFLAIGNHDYPSAASVFLQYATLPNGSHPTDTSYDFYHDGYHYIFLGSDSPSGLNSYFSAETLEWLDNALAQDRDESRPTFIFLHQPMYNTVSGSLPGEGWHGVTNESEFKAVLAKYPEVVMFNGHTHWEMNSVGNAFDGTDELPIHIFNCASVSYLWSGFNTIKGENLYGSHGYAVDIYDGRVVVRGRDFVNGLWISSAQYSFRLEGEGGEGTTGGTSCEHEFVITDLQYENGYLQNGLASYTCTACGKSIFETAAPMIIFSGYSVSTFNTSSIAVGYTVDFAIAEKYKALTGKEITIGMTAAAYDNLLNEGKPINADGTVSGTTSGIVINYVVEVGYMHISMILKSSDWTKYADKRVILCAYYIENSEVYYICQEGKATQSADYITYRSIFGE